MQSWQDGQRNVQDDIAHLQEVMIKAVTLGQRLPGLNKPVIIPHQCHVGPGATHPLLIDNLSPSLNLEKLPEVLHLMSADEYQRHVANGHDDWYLTFQPPHVGTSRIQLVISALRGHPGRKPPPVEIGNLQAEFHFADGRWEAVSMPNLYISDMKKTDSGDRQ
jgi:hypothetical protein